MELVYVIAWGRVELRINFHAYFQSFQNYSPTDNQFTRRQTFGEYVPNAKHVQTKLTY